MYLLRKHCKWLIISNKAKCIKIEMLTRQRKLTLIISQPLIGMIRKPDTDKTFFKIILSKKQKKLENVSDFLTHTLINSV